MPITFEDVGIVVLQTPDGNGCLELFEYIAISWLPLSVARANRVRHTRSCAYRARHVPAVTDHGTRCA